MRVSKNLLLISAIATLALGGCLGAGEDRVLSIEATGTIDGFVFLDNNGDGELGPGDVGYADVEVGLTSIGSVIPVFQATSDADGLFTIRRVDVATWEIFVDSASVGDSLELALTDPESFTLAPDDTAEVLVGVSFPQISVEEARVRASGDKVFVEGIALNAHAAFGDESVHLVGATAAIRATAVEQAPLTAGDSVRLLGTISEENGQPTLDDVTASFIETVEVPAPDTVTAATATSADGGTLDAALVSLDSVTVSDTVTVTEGLQLTVSDASGTARVVLDDDAPIDNPEQFGPDAVIDVVGLLVPDGSGAWIVKPRSSDDLTVRTPAPN